MSTQQRALGSVADLMAGLMMVFLFIAIAYMIEIQSNQKALADGAKKAEEARIQAEASEKAALASAKEALESRRAAEAASQEADERRKSSEKVSATMQAIAGEYSSSKQALENALHAEFEPDLKRWRAEISDGSIRFLEPDILFDTSSAEIKPAFKDILDDFFPRYLSILTSQKFRDEIEEVRIEGHTSTEWRDAVSEQDRYLSNAELSQRRALAVLDHCFRSRESEKHRAWLVSNLRANGLSFARPVPGADGAPDPARSRRVEFRVITRTTEKIRRILDASGKTEQNE